MLSFFQLKNERYNVKIYRLVLKLCSVCTNSISTPILIWLCSLHPPVYMNEIHLSIIPMPPCMISSSSLMSIYIRYPYMSKLIGRQTVNSWSRYCFTKQLEITVKKTEELNYYCLWDIFFGRPVSQFVGIFIV